ncbi:phosphoglycolate phosphatase [Paenibacillus sp. DS2015]|uniref:HAD-IA family hydrolase n=1 Tax=Paenibacillus sp. DS2015 TaxID=3373917 RepID=UPI003D22A7B0
MKKHVVFDFDGTLVDSAEVIVKVYNELAVQYKLKKLEREEYQIIMNLPLRKRIKALDASIFRIFTLGKIGKEFKDKYKSYLELLNFVDGIIDVVSELKGKGYIISIITSNSELNINTYLNHKEINLFSHITSSKGLFGKDQAIKRYMREHQISNEELIYIGDEVRDIYACKRNHVEVIAVSWGLYNSEMLLSKNPNYLIQEPHEIISIVE